MTTTNTTTRPTRAIRNHNPLNIRKGNDWQGEDPAGTDREFEVFINDAYGFRAAFKILKNGFKAQPSRNTIRKIITRWAPPSDGNNTEEYIKVVSQRARINPDEKLTYVDLGRMVDIVKAMAFVESGHEYDERVIITGYELAG